MCLMEKRQAVLRRPREWPGGIFQSYEREYPGGRLQRAIQGQPVSQEWGRAGLGSPQSLQHPGQEALSYIT